MKQVTTIIDGGVTADTIENWKRQHRKVFKIEVVDCDETIVGYFKRPNIADYSVINKIAKTDEVESARQLFNSCWLGGSEIMKTDSAVFLAAVTQLGQVTAAQSHSIKNL